MSDTFLLFVGLAHVQRAGGDQAYDWALARAVAARARRVLRQHLVSPRLPEPLTMAAHAASEDLRTCAAHGRHWPAAQAQAVRVLPVALRVLAAVAETQVAA